MFNQDYHVKIVTREATSLVGLKIVTDMQNATIDCPELWHKFVPHMEKITGKTICYFGESFGVSVVTDQQKGIFEYWAAVPKLANAVIPVELQEIVLPAGLYASSQIASLDALGDVFNYIYLEWMTKQQDYSINNNSICFELYNNDYHETGAVQVFVELVEKR